jgi:hypothetical protein
MTRDLGRIARLRRLISGVSQEMEEDHLEAVLRRLDQVDAASEQREKMGEQPDQEDE